MDRWLSRLRVLPQQYIDLGTPTRVLGTIR